MTALYVFPAWLLLVLAVAVFSALACGGLLLTRRVFGALDFRTHNDSLFVFSGVAGSLFTITVAFIIAIVWQEYNSASQRVAVEVTAAGNLWHVAVGLPPPLRREVRTSLREFGALMVDDEWPAMRSGGSSARAEALLTRATEDIARFRPAQPGESTVQGAMLQHLAELHNARHLRLDDNQRGVSAFAWGTLFFETAAIFSFLYMVGLATLRLQLSATVAVAAVIAAMFVLIFEMDFPFRGDLAVPPEIWRAWHATHLP